MNNLLMYLMIFFMYLINFFIAMILLICILLTQEHRDNNALHIHLSNIPFTKQYGHGLGYCMPRLSFSFSP